MRIGLDFGTSTTLISESRGTGPTVVPIGRVNPWMPSVLGLDGARWLVGDDASHLLEPQLIRSIKRAITSRTASVTISDGDRVIDVDVDDAVSKILSTVSVSAATEYLSLGDASVVRLGCPAMWTADQRERLLRVAEQAGIGVGDSTLIDEPIAAGVAWVNECLRLGRDVIGTVLVIDMGGGTLDAAVLDVEARVGSTQSPLISVLAANGIDEAGDAVDSLIAIELAATGDFGDFEREESWLLRGARELKADLATNESAAVALTLSDGASRVARYSRDQLSEAFAPQAERMMGLIWRCLRAAQMTIVPKLGGPSIAPHQSRAISEASLAASVDYVLIAGGMARSHLLPETLGAWFPSGKLYSPAEAQPDQLIALGLSDADTFERMNLHRPGFDIALEWTEAEVPTRELIYRAYQPLYNASQLIYFDSAKYSWKGDRGFPTRGEGRLIARSVSGENIEFSFEGAAVDALPWGFGHRTPYLSIEPNGRIYYIDGAGMERECQVDQWPVILGDRQQKIILRRTERESGWMDRLVWHQRPYD